MVIFEMTEGKQWCPESSVGARMFLGPSGLRLITAER